MTTFEALTGISILGISEFILIIYFVVSVHKFVYVDMDVFTFNNSKTIESSVMKLNLWSYEVNKHRRVRSYT